MYWKASARPAALESVCASTRWSPSSTSGPASVAVAVDDRHGRSAGRRVRADRCPGGGGRRGAGGGLSRGGGRGAGRRRGAGRHGGRRRGAGRHGGLLVADVNDLGDGGDALR